MNERDVMALLAEANPVRVDDLPPPDAAAGERIVAARRRPSRRVALVAAIALAALAASLIAVFATGGGPARHSVGPMEADLFSPTVARPLLGPEVTLAAASAAIGQPIVLPDNSFVRPSDAGHAWVSGTFPNVTAAVSFPSRGVFIEYTAPPPLSDMSTSYQAIARENPGSFETIGLNGRTALAVRQNSDDTGHNFGAVVFVLNGVEISVFGHYDQAPLQSLAQSIVDQESASSETLGVSSPPTLAHPLGNGKVVTFAEAARAFGGRIVQPHTAVVGSADAGAVWLAGEPQLTAAAITYPRADVWVDYTWPVSYDGGYDDQLLRYHTTDSRIAHTVLLDGVPAQVVFHSWKQPRWSSFYPSVHFDAGGVKVTVWGHQDEATLEAIARSIVARSEKPPAGQLGDVAGVQVYPYLSHGRQISVSDASATLGSRVVLPGSALAPEHGAHAWAEGTCPHIGSTPATTEVCAVWISFGSGLSVAYIRPPAYLGSGPEWRLQARGLGRRGAAVRLDGVPALSIHRNGGAGYPGRVEFDLGGTRIVVAGDYSPARLQGVARSIVKRALGTPSPTPPTQFAQPTVPDLHVGSVAAADALLPFKVVLPSARPLVIEVTPPNPPAYPVVHQASAFFDTPGTGPYEVVEQPADGSAGIWKVSQLRKWAATCRNRVVCPVHKIVLVHGTHVLLVGAPGRPGGLTAFWLRGDRARSVLTWVKGPTDYAHGDLSRHRFRVAAARAVAAEIIARGG